MEVAKGFVSTGIPGQTAAVVLGRKFSKNALLLDVEKVASYLGLEDKKIEKEHEVIVKNGATDYRFTINDIVTYKESYGWWTEL